VLRKGEGELVRVGEGLNVEENEAPVLHEAVALPVGVRDDEDVGVTEGVDEGVGDATVATTLTP